jgi:hypothetical protein
MSSEDHIDCWVVLLREHRAYQVADVVMGKLAVRTAARQVPAQIEPPAGLAAETMELDSNEPEEAESPSD